MKRSKTVVKAWWKVWKQVPAAWVVPQSDWGLGGADKLRHRESLPLKPDFIGVPGKGAHGEKKRAVSSTGLPTAHSDSG